MEAEAAELSRSPSLVKVSALTVTELTQEIRFLLGASGVLRGLAVRGEMVDLRSYHGMLLFHLRDEEALVDCIMFRSSAATLPFTPQNGQEVVVLGDVEVYPRKGTYQIVVRAMEPWGVGAQHLAFLQLRDRLQAEGLFRTEEKRPVPLFPNTLGVVTSEQGAALQDILAVLRRRWPLVHVVLAPVPVQGPQASPAMVHALATIGPLVDVVLLARGGGSEGDMGAYNDEELVRAVRACPVPVVSAVGHEVDNTLVDLAADLRAATPSAAAELLTPDGTDIRRGIEGILQDLASSMEGHLGDLGHDLEQIREGTLPLLLRDRLPLERRGLAHQIQVMVQSMEAHRTLWEERLDAQVQVLERVNPRAVLERGYGLLRRWASGRPIQSVEDVGAGDLLRVEVADGEMLCQVLQVNGRT